MKKSLITSLLILFSSIAFAQESYQAFIDLTQAADDRLPVEILLPVIDRDTVEYHMPKVVPGTYSISDFGRFVKDFQAFNSEGEPLSVENISTNRWQILEGKSLRKITYWIEDSFDEFEGYGDNRLFEPGGMSIEADRNVFVMNTFGFIGYVDEYKFQPYQLQIKHSKEIAGATSLQKIASTDSTDTFEADNYNFLADAPIMYSKPDMVTKKIAGADIVVSVYSPNSVLTAKDVMSTIDNLMEAQAQYLGGKLPVERYAYLIYLFDSPSISGSWGALEHSYSSLYTLPEMDPERISQTVRDVAAHEFFHIVTPLNIHSEEIHNFNYIEPEMSQHLWLYEGATEYASQHVQLKYGLYDLEDFLSEMQSKFMQSERYDVDIPYTDFSENILEPENERRYGDVYAGGALIAWGLDLTILKSTDGAKDLQAVLRELSKKYGPNKAFKDEELFSEFEKLTNKEVGDYLRNYVGSTDPIPFDQILGWAGITYQLESNEMVATYGGFTPSLNDDREIIVADTEEMNEFGRDLNLKVGDVLLAWNDEEVNLENFTNILMKFNSETKEKDKVSVLVRRSIKGKQKEVKLKARAKMVKSNRRHQLGLNESLTDSQKKIKEAWMSY